MDLRPLFEPESVAVIGASDDPSKLGYHVMKSLCQGSYMGPIYPINPKRPFVMGIEARKGLYELKGRVDLAVVVVPSGQVEGVFRECIQSQVKGIVLITAGFKEAEGGEGALLQQRLKAIVGDQIPVIGPNTFGMISYHHNLNASFTPEFSLARPGKVALISQSGGMSHLMGFMAIRYGLGLSHVVGLGNRLNLDFQHVVRFLGEDTHVRAMGLYVEGIEAPRELMGAIGEVAGKVRVVVMKAGRGGIADKASLSHTGSLAGDFETFNAAMTQAGALVAEDSEGFLDVLKASEVLFPPKGRRVAILSGQAGPGMVAYDTCLKEGLVVDPFYPDTLEEMERLLPPLAIRINPVDLGPLWYDQDAVQKVVQKVLEDPRIDALIFLMMFASANRGSIPALIRGLKEKSPQKPIFACIVAPGDIWTQDLEEGEELGLICNFATPERAARACAMMIRQEALRARIEIAHKGR